MKKHKKSLVDDLSGATAATVAELRSAFAIGFSQEAMRLLGSHKNIFHAKDSNDCVICRSLRRSVLRGMK